MQINLAKSAGFCFGVKRALDVALKAANTKKEICMLGDIVHNEEVVKKIEKTGIKKIKHLKKTKDKTLLIRAHGTSLATFTKAKNCGYEIIDATCPMVCEIHKIVRERERKGYTIIIIGDQKHDEVQGISGQLKNKPIIIDPVKNNSFKKFKKIKKAAVVAQSTQNLQKTLRIVKALKKYTFKLTFFNTICRPTQIKQKEIKIMPLKNDIMIIIGSKSSANTKRLYEISKSLNNSTFWIQSKKGLKLKWFNGTKTVGITAGASTPDSTTKNIIKYIQRIKSKRKMLSSQGKYS